MARRPVLASNSTAFVFASGTVSPARLSRGVRAAEKVLKEMRDEFTYWYPVDLRNSAKELIPNHLTFFAFHHAALFEEKMWPRGFSVNGMITLNGKKMSKTGGNFVTWRAALDKYGADALRLSLALVAAGMDAADWSARGAEDAKLKVESVVPFVKKTLRESTTRKPDQTDAWLLSTVNRRIGYASSAIEEMKIRRAASVVYLDFWNDVRAYLHRAAKPRKQTLTAVFGAWVRLFTPFTPFVVEVLYCELGGKGLVAEAEWPPLSDFPIDEEAELSEQLVNRVMDDARNVLRVVKGPRKKLNVYAASDQATKYFLELTGVKEKKGNVGAVVKKYDSLRVPPDRVFKLQYELGEDLVKTLSSLPKFDEFGALTSAADFMS